MSVQALYQQKRVAAADAVRHIRNGDTIVVPTAVGEPPTLLTALSEQRRDFLDVKVAQILAVRKYGYFDPETVQHVRHEAYFFSGASRAGGQEGWIDFIPAYFSELPQLIKRNLIPADVVVMSRDAFEQQKAMVNTLAWRAAQEGEAHELAA